MSFLLALVLSFKSSGVQWWCREGDWEVFGEGLHRWQGEAETAKAGGILLQFCTLAKINLIYVYFLGIKDESVISSKYTIFKTSS